MSEAATPTEKEKVAKVKRLPEREPLFQRTFASTRHNTGGGDWLEGHHHGNGLLQRQCACGQHTIAGEECDECRQKRETASLQRAISPAPSNVTSLMEPRFGYDFSQIQLHTDEKAAESRGSVNAPAYTMVQRRAAPYIKKITVHLTPPQTAELEWKGTPPTDAPGSDHFTVSTGKGYGDPDDPPGTCRRQCCKDADTQCAPPWNQPSRVGSCCTFYGNNFWTGTPLDEHNGWKWWTPIQPYYSSRGIALHQHTEVTGQPISHGCVRMDEDNAKRIHDFSNGRRTNVTIDGRAAPVGCKTDRQCDAAAGSGSSSGARGEVEGVQDTRVAAVSEAVVEGLEGVMS